MEEIRFAILMIVIMGSAVAWSVNRLSRRIDELTAKIDRITNTKDSDHS
jgi:hypothetical protein